MSETNNMSEESSDDSSIRFINRKSGPRRRLSFSSDSSDCNSTNPTNTLIGRKRSRNPVKWIRNLQKHNRIKDDEGIKMAKIEKETHLEEAERARSQMAADRMATSEKLFVFSFDLKKALAFPKLTTSVAYYK
ncbi:uncharacterized protein TNCV_5096511 [Trichonephila clavipes]|nr:uncharacterized protein TNCV_5096511 [Trichonephila clavipes]